MLFSSVASGLEESSTVGSRGNGRVHGDGLDVSGGSGVTRGSGAVACLPWLVLFLFKDIQSTFTVRDGDIQAGTKGNAAMFQI